MSLEQPYRYKVSDGVRYTQNEEKKVIRLLKDVRNNVSILRPDIADQRLDAILEVIEIGEWKLQNLNVSNRKVLDSIKQVELIYNIDLSQAKNIITQYRHDSEGGCQSCISRKIYNPHQHATPRNYSGARKSRIAALQNSMEFVPKNLN